VSAILARDAGSLIRLVTQNGVILPAIAAVGVLLLITTANVSVLVVLYSIDVFLTFSLSIARLVHYWLRHREDARWKVRLVLSPAGFDVCAGILVDDVEKFTKGGWITLIITSLVIATGLPIRRHYDEVAAGVSRADQLYVAPTGHFAARPRLDPAGATAAFIIGCNRSGPGPHLAHCSEDVARILQEFPDRQRPAGRCTAATAAIERVKRPVREAPKPTEVACVLKSALSGGPRRASKNCPELHSVRVSHRPVHMAIKGVVAQGEGQWGIATPG
jgi:hypothetical protein